MGSDKIFTAGNESVHRLAKQHQEKVFVCGKGRLVELNFNEITYTFIFVKSSEEKHLWILMRQRVTRILNTFQTVCKDIQQFQGDVFYIHEHTHSTFQK